MAKALLLLRAAETGGALQAQLLAGLGSAFEDCSATTVQLLSVPAENLFYDPASPWPLPHSVIEVITAPGKALVESYDRLQAALAGLALAPDSLALVMLERIYIPSAPQACYYHQLMFRKAGLSRSDYLEYYSRFHCRMGFNTPGVAGYSQNDVDGEASAELAGRLAIATCDAQSISELRMSSVEAFVSNPEVMAVAEPAAIDEARFVDRARALAFTSAVVQRWGDFERIGESVYPQHFPG